MNDFASDLAYSHSQADAWWWAHVYRSAFPDLAGMVSVRSDGWAQRGGIDRVLTLASGKTIAVDEKVRRKDYGDILLEYLSDRDRKIRGWIAKDLACDYIAYAYETSGLCHLLPFRELRRAWHTHHLAWVNNHRRVEAQNPGYVTVGVAVPTDIVLDAIREAITITWAPA